MYVALYISSTIKVYKPCKTRKGDKWLKKLSCESQTYKRSEKTVFRWDIRAHGLLAPNLPVKKIGPTFFCKVVQKNFRPFFSTSPEIIVRPFFFLSVKFATSLLTSLIGGLRNTCHGWFCTLVKLCHRWL